MKILDVPAYKQSEDGCGPTSLRMVLGYYGLNVSEKLLKEFTDLRKDCVDLSANPHMKVGCSARDLMNAARRTGFSANYHDLSEISDLEDCVNRGIPPIVDWYCQPIKGVGGGHYSVVTGFDEGNLFLLDPLDGKKMTISKEDFDLSWHDFWGRKLSDKRQVIIRRMITISPHKSYGADGRTPIGEIYDAMNRLDPKLWKKEIINGDYRHPVVGYTTISEGKTRVIVGGFHGTEPGGVMAIAQSVDCLNSLARKGAPMIVINPANPGGYDWNWRYTCSNRHQSTGDTEHVLLDESEKGPKFANPTCRVAKNLVDWTIRKIFNGHCPERALDLHEDDLHNETYIYSHGQKGAEDPVAKRVAGVLRKSSFAFGGSGRTRFGQEIKNGIVAPVEDYSFDSFLAATKMWDIKQEKIIDKPCAESVIVVEIPQGNLNDRVKVHSDVIKKFVKMS